MLNSEQQSALIRLFGDEGLVDVLGQICQETADTYKERAYRIAHGDNPILVSITQEASKGYAFENIMAILRFEFEKLTHEEEDVRED